MLMSGYGAAALQEAEGLGAVLLEKPFTARSLEMKLAESMGGRRASPTSNPERPLSSEIGQNLDPAFFA